MATHKDYVEEPIGTEQWDKQMQDTMAHIMNNLFLYSLIVATIAQLWFGSFYDVWGRRAIIGVCFWFMFVFASIVPRMSKDLVLLQFNRMFIGLFAHILIANPLIPDYVDRNSTGRGYALAVLGGLSGSVVS